MASPHHKIPPWFLRRVLRNADLTLDHDRKRFVDQHSQARVNAGDVQSPSSASLSKILLVA
jgi:hypothetical protein